MTDQSKAKVESHYHDKCFSRSLSVSVLKGISKISSSQKMKTHLHANEKWGDVHKNIKTIITTTITNKMAQYISSKTWEAPRSKIDLKDVIYTVFQLLSLKC